MLPNKKVTKDINKLLFFPERTNVNNQTDRCRTGVTQILAVNLSKHCCSNTNMCEETQKYEIYPQSKKSVLMKASLSHKILLNMSRPAATTSCLASIWMTDRSLTTPCFSNCGLLLGVHVAARPIRLKRSWPSAVGVSLQGKREQPQKHMNDWEIVMSSQWGRSTDLTNHSCFLFFRTVTKSLLLPE